jgi:hypothetical protein
MARYTPELIAHVRHRYEDTDDTLAAIAADCGISERGIHRLRDREGWPRRSDRPARDLPPAMRALDEATALLAARATAPPAERPGPLHSFDTGRAASAEPVDGRSNEDTSAIARIERLVEKELAAEETVRAGLGPLPRPPADAERAARTLATLTQTLHALQRLRSGLAPDTGSNDDDDMPRDIDEFRRDLARRIDAFVESRIDRRDAGGDSRPVPMDAAGERLPGAGTPASGPSG